MIWTQEWNRSNGIEDERHDIENEIKREDDSFSHDSLLREMTLETGEGERYVIIVILMISAS